jgi:hypothetical protein
VAWLTSSVGLSLSLGAFLAGLIISESEYNHQALGNVLPFKDIFSGFFFVSIGMLLDVRFLIDHLWWVLLLVAAIMFSKTILAALAAGTLRFPLRTTLLVGLGFCQVGEFSFVLAEMGGRFGLLAGDHYRMFLAVAILTMGATPFLVPLAPRLADGFLKIPGLARFQAGILPDKGIQLPPLNDHLIIVGFAVNGRNLARAARGGEIPYLILEEFETAVEIFTRVLQKYLFPKDHIEKFTAEVRSEGYRMFRKPEVIPASFCDLTLHMPDMEVTTFLIKPGSWADGKTLGEMALRKKYGVTAMAVRHQGQTRPNPDGDTRLAAQDLVVVIGHPDRLIDLEDLLERGPKPAAA